MENTTPNPGSDQAIDEIYTWVDEQVAAASPRCEISGACCRFREYGHRLYISRVEAERLFEVPLPAENQTDESVSPETVKEVCPYQSRGLCTARGARPLACRIFFCDPEFDQAGQELTEEALKRLKSVHIQYQIPWEYRQLADFFDSTVQEKLLRGPGQAG